MNGLAIRRTGRSPLTQRTGWFLALFPASALLWWLFEFLNQFVRNWHYSGIETLDDWDYFMQATLPFSSVLPAVASTWAWLRSYPRLDAMRLPPLRGHPALGWVALVVGVLGLGGIGVRPDLFYAMLWLAPLLVLCGLQQAVLGETYFAPLARGDWRPLLQPALAALVCGFFWEMWNYGSPREVALQHPVRAALPCLRNAAARLCGLPAVRRRVRADHGPDCADRRAAAVVAARPGAVRRLSFHGNSSSAIVPATSAKINARRSGHGPSASTMLRTSGLLRPTKP
jgi:hypothetical protein